jgi:hypothetical protein
MSRVEQIEQAIQELTPEEFSQLARRIYALEQERWEHQLDHDASSGKLDFLRDEARNERESGTLKAWPPGS